MGVLQRILNALRPFDRSSRLDWVPTRSNRGESVVRLGRTSAVKIDVPKLEQALGYTIHNPQLFHQALLHRSYLQFLDETSAESNERLEFLGDAILNLAVSEYLYEEYSTADEGELTKIRARLVNRKALAAYGRQIDLWNFILLSTSAAQSVERGTETILSDTYEALVAAIYLDGGYKPAREFVQSQILAAIARGNVSISDENFKSQLLELAQAKGLGVPRYAVFDEQGPDHDRTFTVQVLLGDLPYGVGAGKSKKDAEQSAAEQALYKLRSYLLNDDEHYA